jgi:hypothetical protein
MESKTRKLSPENSASSLRFICLPSLRAKLKSPEMGESSQGFQVTDFQLQARIAEKVKDLHRSRQAQLRPPSQ